jgi:opacity protein-like surface antigen
MKKVILLSIVMSVLFSYSTVMAQEKGKIRVGLGLALGTESAIDDTTGEPKLGFGFTVGGDYFVSDAISIAPSYSFFFKSKVDAGGGQEVSLKASSIDVDGKYYFVKSGVNVYGFAGISFAFVKASVTVDLGNGLQEISASESQVGVNLGAGLDYYLSEKLFLNGQAKYTINGLEQLQINLGVGFNLN